MSVVVYSVKLKARMDNEQPCAPEAGEIEIPHALVDSVVKRVQEKARVTERGGNYLYYERSESLRMCVAPPAEPRTTLIPAPQWPGKPASLNSAFDAMFPAQNSDFD